MIKKILIAPNSFKECADSVEVCRLFNKYLTHENLYLISAPISDGGDGFLKVITRAFALEIFDFEIRSPYSSQISVQAAYDRKNKIAYIESAAVLGLSIIPDEFRNPMKLSSKGLGELLIQISNRLPLKKIVIGIGGTGTNDLGLGMLHELGFHFYGAQKISLVPLPENFHEIQDFDSHTKFEIPVELITDVKNPLLGQHGATYIYGPQKGLISEDLEFLDEQFERLLQLFSTKGKIIKQNSLSGAGGGLAAGMQIFLNAHLRSSSEFILNDLRINEHLNNCDYALTGEGSFDHQSALGKGAGIIIDRCSKPVFLVCGKIDNKISFNQNIFPIELKKYFENQNESIIRFEEGIKKASSEIISKVNF